MVRTRQQPREERNPNHATWSKQWASIRDTPIPDPEKHILKLMKYYPKTIHALRSVSRQYHNFQTDLDFSKHHSDLILSRANKALINDLSIDLSRARCPYRLLRYITSLRVLERDHIQYGPKKNFITGKLGVCKRLRSVEIKTHSDNVLPVLKSLRKVTLLQSLAMDSPPFIPNNKCLTLRTFFPMTVKSLTMIGMLHGEYRDKSDVLLELLKALFKLPCLKQFKFDMLLPPDFDFTKIVFSHLEQNNIAYDIRISSSGSKLIEAKSPMALGNLDFLALSNKVQYTGPLEWDIVQEENVKVQQSSRNALFINTFDIQKQGCFEILLQSCKNITTLDLILADFNLDETNFGPLTELSCLRNILITIHGLSSAPVSLFDSLAICAQNHQGIEFVSLSIYQTVVTDQYKTFIPLMEAGTETIKKAIIKLYSIDKDSEGLGYIYEGLNKLNQLKSFGIFLEEVHWDINRLSENIKIHYRHLDRFLQDKHDLEQFSLVIPFIDLSDPSLDFQNLTGLQRLSIRMIRDEAKLININLVGKALALYDVKHLELEVPTIKEEDFLSVMKLVRNMKKLVSIRLRIVMQEFPKAIEDHFKALFKSHMSLVHVIVGIRRPYFLPSLKVFVFNRNKDIVDIGNFFSRGNTVLSSANISQEFYNCS